MFISSTNAPSGFPLGVFLISSSVQRELGAPHRSVAVGFNQDESRGRESSNRVRAREECNGFFRKPSWGDGRKFIVLNNSSRKWFECEIIGGGPVEEHGGWERSRTHDGCQSDSSSSAAKWMPAAARWKPSLSVQKWRIHARPANELLDNNPHLDASNIHPGISADETHRQQALFNCPAGTETKSAPHACMHRVCGRSCLRISSRKFIRKKKRQRAIGRRNISRKPRSSKPACRVQSVQTRQFLQRLTADQDRRISCPVSGTLIPPEDRRNETSYSNKTSFKTKLERDSESEIGCKKLKTNDASNVFGISGAATETCRCKDVSKQRELQRRLESSDGRRAVRVCRRINIRRSSSAFSSMLMNGSTENTPFLKIIEGLITNSIAGAHFEEKNKIGYNPITFVETKTQSISSEKEGSNFGINLVKEKNASGIEGAKFAGSRKCRCRGCQGEEAQKKETRSGPQCRWGCNSA